MLTGRQHETLPSTTKVHPREHCIAITLRSGKELETPVHNEKVNKEEQEASSST